MSLPIRLVEKTDMNILLKDTYWKKSRFHQRRKSDTGLLGR